MKGMYQVMSTGLAQSIVIVKGEDVYEYGQAQEDGLHWVLPSNRSAEYPLDAYEPVGSEHATLEAARYFALQAKVGDLFQAHLQDSMPLAWISFVQTFFVLVLFSPSVIYKGSMQAAVAQVAVVTSACMNNAPFIMTAARVSTAVAIGNVMLALLVWQSAYSTMDKVSAAWRSAVVIVTGFAIICTNEYISRVASRRRRDTLTAQ